MNAPLFPPGLQEARGRRWLWVAAGIWVVLVSGLSVVNSVGLFRTADPGAADAQNASVQALAGRVADLEQHVAELGRLPKPIAREDMEALKQGLGDRVDRLEQAQTAEHSDDQVTALAARLDTIEKRLQRPVPTGVVVARRPADPVLPKPPVPPFAVLGLELRGGERFLAIAGPGLTSVRDIRLLREGETLGAWQWVSVEAGSAVFRIDGQVQRIPLP